MTGDCVTFLASAAFVGFTDGLRATTGAGVADFRIGTVAGAVACAGGAAICAGDGTGVEDGGTGVCRTVRGYDDG